MALNVGKEIAALKRMTVTELRKKHVEVFGEPTRSGHKDYLVKRIAWRLQGPASPLSPKPTPEKMATLRLEDGGDTSCI